MIVAIGSLSLSSVPVLEFRIGDSVTDAVDAFAAVRSVDPADFVGLDTGWLAGAVELRELWLLSPDPLALVEDLARVKQELIKELSLHRDDERLEEDVYAEIPPGSGKLFSCSALSRSNWTGLEAAKNEGLLVYGLDGFKVTTADELDSHALMNNEDLTEALGEILESYLTERAVAAAAIAAVMSATTVAGARTAAAGYLAT